jgi:hypothetical protein
VDNDALALLCSLLVGLTVFTATHVHAWDALTHGDQDPNPPQAAMHARAPGPH